MALSISQKVVVGKESTYGTAPATTTGIDQPALPIETANINLTIDPFNDQTKRGTAGLDSEVYPTVRHAEGSVEGPFFTDECAYLLMALFGSQVAVATGASNANTHRFKCKTDFSSVPNSLTIDVRDDAQDFSYLGCYVSSMTLRFSAAEGILTYTANVMGQNQETAANLANTAFAEPVPIFGWTGTARYLASTKTADSWDTAGTPVTGLIDAEFTINRPTALTYTFQNSQICYRADPGPMEVTARITADFDSTQTPTAAQWVADYVSASNHERGWRFDFTNAQTGSALRIMRVYMPAASILDAPLEVDRGDTSVRLNIGMRAVNNSNTNINGPISVALTSRKTTNYGT